MHLWYWKAPNGNVGDDINPWLWPKVFGEDFFCDTDPDRFIGIGSVLHDGHAGLQKVVFGAGARRPDRLPSDQHHLSVRFVRGPRTAAALSHLDARYISDPAILMPMFHQGRRGVTGGGRTIGFVPYFETPSDLSADIAAALGLVLIEPTLGVEDFIDKLLRCDAVICEAMHGAILADAYRVPWRGCRIVNGVAEGRVSLFKWADWLESLGIEVSIPGVLPQIFYYAPRRIREQVYRLWSEDVINFVDKILAEGRWVLSRETRLRSAQEHILEEAERLRVEYRPPASSIARCGHPTAA